MATQKYVHRSREGHYLQAQKLLTEIYTARMMGASYEVVQTDLALAQIHATLAATPWENQVAKETTLNTKFSPHLDQLMRFEHQDPETWALDDYPQPLLMGCLISPPATPTPQGATKRGNSLGTILSDFFHCAWCQRSYCLE